MPHWEQKRASSGFWRPQAVQNGIEVLLPLARATFKHKSRLMVVETYQGAEGVAETCRTGAAQVAAQESRVRLVGRGVHQAVDGAPSSAGRELEQPALAVRVAVDQLRGGVQRLVARGDRARRPARRRR